MQFYEVMQFFLLPENEEIWSRVQDLASNGDTARLENYVLEAYRLVSQLRVARFAGQETEIEGKSVRPGDMLVLDVVSVPLEYSESKITFY